MPLESDKHSSVHFNIFSSLFHFRPPPSSTPPQPPPRTHIDYSHTLFHSSWGACICRSGSVSCFFCWFLWMNLILVHLQSVAGTVTGCELLYPPGAAHNFKQLNWSLRCQPSWAHTPINTSILLSSKVEDKGSWLNFSGLTCILRISFCQLVVTLWLQALFILLTTRRGLADDCGWHEVVSDLRSSRVLAASWTQSRRWSLLLRPAFEPLNARAHACWSSTTYYLLCWAYIDRRTSYIVSGRTVSTDSWFSSLFCDPARVTDRVFVFN